MKGGEPIFIDKNSKIGILMLHGFSSTSHEFKDLCPFLAEKGFTVYAPLMAGHGTNPEDMIRTGPEEWKKSVREAYLKLKEKTGKVFLIGNSFGSNMAFWLAKEFDNEQAGIITLDAPVFLRNHKFIVFRLYTYGLFRKFYRKPPRLYQIDYIDMMDEVTYSKIPVRSLRQFLSFIKNETKPNLDKVKIPALITHSSTDPIIHPKSATYIYERIGSETKKIHWFVSNNHAFTVNGGRLDVFQQIFNFIQEVLKNE